MSARTNVEYADNSAWETERVAVLRTKARNGTVAGLVGAGVAVAAIVALILVESARTFVPVPIVIDRATGETTTVLPLSAASVPMEEALDKSYVARFVQAREGYSWDFLQRDYNTVTRMASPAVFKTYNAQFEGPDPLDKKLGANTVWRVRVVNVRLDLNTARKGENVRKGEAVVTFEREVRNIDRQAAEAPTRHVATLRYEYQPRAMRTEAERMDNPLGFVITAYRTDSEVSK